MGVRLLVRSCWASGSEGDAVFEFDQTRITIGRGRGADVRLPHRAVSVRHATIEHSGRGYTLVDHETTNGTTVQGSRVVAGRSKPLRDGDRIELGGFSIVFLASVPVTTVTSQERTASLARRLARDSLDVDAQALRPTLSVLNGPSEGTRVTLPDPPAKLVLGRGEECDLTLDDADLSREHAEIDVALDGVRVRDLASKNGVWVGERRVTERLLGDRDEVRVGSTVVRFEDPAAAQVAALEEGDDDAVETPRWQEPEPEPVPEPEAPAPDEPPPAPAPEPKPKGESVAPADMVIYVLASVVFAVSILGLIWLLRSG
ncbi:MAG: FHA domain-containing protein [Sandaracinaceae bacterium]|nr:FHA domain-containing protein [Sandaracinaceae bacterium]